MEAAKTAEWPGAGCFGHEPHELTSVQMPMNLSKLHFYGLSPSLKEIF